MDIFSTDFIWMQYRNHPVLNVYIFIMTGFEPANEPTVTNSSRIVVELNRQVSRVNLTQWILQILNNI